MTHGQQTPEALHLRDSGFPALGSCNATLQYQVDLVVLHVVRARVRWGRVRLQMLLRTVHVIMPQSEWKCTKVEALSCDQAFEIALFRPTFGVLTV
jgi:hypothetical protein